MIYQFREQKVESEMINRVLATGLENEYFELDRLVIFSHFPVSADFLRQEYLSFQAFE